jgi:WD40 repeat protein
MPADEALPLQFRLLGFARQTRAACLMFCLEKNAVALPRELVELIGHHIVASGGSDGFVPFPQTFETLQRVATLRGHSRVILAIKVFTLPTNAGVTGGTQLLASASRDWTVRLWNLSSRECVAALEGHADAVRCLACFSLPLDDDNDKSGVVLASGSDDQAIILWDVVNRSRVATLLGHTDGVFALAVFRGAAGQCCLASSGGDGSIRLWDLRTRSAIATLPGDKAGVDSLCVFTDARGSDLLVSGGLYGSIKVWDSATHENVFNLDGHQKRVSSLLFFLCEDGMPALVSASSDHTLRVWDLASRETITTVDGVIHPDALACVAGDDGRVMVACVLGGGEVTVVDLSTRRFVFQTLPEVSGDAYTVEVAVDQLTGLPLFAVAAYDDDADCEVIQLWEPSDPEN